MMRKRKLQETEYDEQETLIQSRTPVTIEDLIKKDRKRLSVSAVFEIILIMMEIYVMFNMGEELLVIVIGLIPIAALLYLIITSAADIGQLSKQQDEEKYSEIVRAQKGLHSRHTRGDRHSSRVEAKKPALLSSRDGYLLELTGWTQGSQAS